MQRRDCPGAELDRLGPGGHQHPDCLAFTSTARLGQADTGQGLAGRAHGVDVVALSAATAGGTLRAVNLDYHLAASQQGRRQASPIAAGALDSPQSGLVASPWE